MKFFNDNAHLSAHHLMLYRALKDEDMRLFRDDLEDVLIEYKLGMLDPGRLTATFERIARVYKINKVKRDIMKKLEISR